MRLVAAGIAAMLICGSAQAQSVTVGMAAAPTSVDPHYHTFSPNETLDVHIFDRLVQRDAKSNLIPGLATSWKMIDDTTWEIKLRHGVKFQNGDEFTAQDVAYTWARVPTVVNSPGSFSIFTKSVVSVDVVDPYTVRMKTAAIYPNLPVDLANVFIIPKSLGPTPKTEDFNSGKDAIGTGAYKLVSYKPGDRAELERNDQWWGEKPYWQHVTLRFIPNDGARTAALLAGDVQFIEAVPTEDAVRLHSDNRVALAETAGQRTIFLYLDRSRTGTPVFITGPNGETLAKNPLNDLRVRQALSMAINRDAIVDRIMEGAADPAGQFVTQGRLGYVSDIAPPPNDVNKAKALLAEAGFPNGFRITLQGPSDRYVNSGEIIQAIGQMWTRIGVQTTVDAMTWPNYIARASKQEFAAFLGGWTFREPANSLRSLLYTYSPSKGWGAENRGRYSNPTFDALIDKVMVTSDDTARQAIVQQAMKLATDDVGVIPLHIQKNIWAMKAGLTYAARADEVTRTMDLRPQ